MSMNAVFIQVTPEELVRIEAVPALAEALFQPGVASPLAAFAEVSKKTEERIRAAGPQQLSKALANLDPRIREQLEQRLGLTAEQFASGSGGEQLLKVLQERRERAMGMPLSTTESPRLSLDKEWHGVHYLLCGKTEPDESLPGNAVLGGKTLGDDDEGFSGYGPARYFTADEVAQLSNALSHPELEAKAKARFDVDKMNSLQIYPGFRTEDIDPLMDSLRQLRLFYTDTAKNGKAIITCLV
jgi:hypothetical protein